MKKVLLWIIVIAVLIFIGMTIFSSDKDTAKQDVGDNPTSEELTSAGYKNLETDDDVFNAINEATGFLD